MKVSKFAHAAGVTPDLVRYYARIGLLQPRRENRNGYKRFNSADLGRLHFVLRAKRLGFTLEEIKRILSMAHRGDTPCPMVREILQARVEETRRRLDELMTLQTRMENALTQWGGMPDGEPDGEAVCVLIEALGDDLPLHA